MSVFLSTSNRLSSSPLLINKNKKLSENKNRPKRDERANSPFELKKKFCPFSQPGSPIIDYKDTKLLSIQTSSSCVNCEKLEP